MEIVQQMLDNHLNRVDTEIGRVLHIFDSHVEAMNLNLQEHKYVIERHGRETQETKQLLINHVEEENELVASVKSTIEDMARRYEKMEKNSEIMADYVSKMAGAAWLMGKLKAVFLWIIALGGAWAIVLAAIKYFKDH